MPKTETIIRGEMVAMVKAHRYPDSESAHCEVTFKDHLEKRLEEPDERTGLRDLELSAYEHRAYELPLEKSGVWLSYTCRYHNPYEVQLELAKIMVATLGKIERGLLKLDNEWGHASTYGQYVLRICKLVNVSAFVMAQKGRYDDDWQHYPLSDLDWRLSTELMHFHENYHLIKAGC